MPYIKPFARSRFSKWIYNVPEITNKGELEYVVFSLMKKYMSNRVYKYTHLHDCIYAVQHCADEFRRRFLDSRENDAVRDNGDIF